jgi:hypothetical protein
MGLCLLRTGGVADGATELRQALSIYERMNIPDADHPKTSLGILGARTAPGN